MQQIIAQVESNVNTHRTGDLAAAANYGAAPELLISMSLDLPLPNIYSHVGAQDSLQGAAFL